MKSLITKTKNVLFRNFERRVFRIICFKGEMLYKLLYTDKENYAEFNDSAENFLYFINEMRTTLHDENENLIIILWFVIFYYGKSF